MLNENIRNLRRARGLSQEELATQLHIVRQTLSKWETGLSVPDADMLTRLAAALDVTVNVLLDETPPSPEAAPTLTDVTERLAQINARLAQEQTHRRRRMRILCISALVLSVLILAGQIAAAAYSCAANREVGAIPGSIGGADGPTHLFVSRFPLHRLPLALGLLIFAASLGGLIHMRRRRRA